MKDEKNHEYFKKLVDKYNQGIDNFCSFRGNEDEEKEKEKEK